MTNSGFPPPAEAAALDAARQALADIIERYCTEDGPVATPVPGLSLFRASSTSTPICAVYRSVLAVAVQGSKRLVLADEQFQYDSRHYLITSVDLPVMGQITEATPDKPYLCAVFDMDAHKIAELASTLQLAPPTPGNGQLGLGVSDLTLPVMDALEAFYRQWVPGELMIFDDTILHEAWNGSRERRVVMIFDVWHPHLSPLERELVTRTVEGLVDYYGEASELGEL